jgi:HAD superfamily hydrolase (TIGR01549 family)
LLFAELAASLALMYQGYLFDLDGTLVESDLDFERIRKELQIHEHEDIIHHVNALPENLRKEKEQRLQEIEIEAAERAQFFPGVVELLEELSVQAVPIGILTRNCRAVLNTTIERLALKVDLALCREDAPPKPDPAGAMQFLKRFALHAPQTLFVGDYKFDIDCGKNAGMKTALFLQGATEVPSWGADFAFSHYKDLRLHIAGPI